MNAVTPAAAMPDDGPTGGPAFATIDELRGMLAAGELSAVELAAYFEDRLARFGERYHALVVRTPERARRAAIRADRRIRAGDTGPLVGVPYGVKDIFGTRDQPTRAGTAAALPDPLRDATAIRGLDRAGAGLAAKVALVELVGFITRRPWSSPQGAAITPWDLERWAGGSSGGSGAAVAAGLVPFALGSETAGSVGSPAAWCGVTGYRPTFGLAGRGGMTPLSRSLDKPGVLAHSARDCALVLAAIAGRDAADPDSLRRPFLASDAVLRLERLRSLRIGVSEADIDEVAPEPTRGPLRDGIRALRELGVRQADVGLPAQFDYREMLEAIMKFEAAAAFQGLIAAGELQHVSDPETRAEITAPSVSAARYDAAKTAQAELRSALADTFSSCDVLVTYNFVFPWPWPRADTKFGQIPIAGGNTAMVWASNVAGLPAAFVPLGIADGQPVSLQIVGPQGADALVLGLASALQATTDWHRALPTFAPPA